MSGRILGFFLLALSACIYAENPVQTNDMSSALAQANNPLANLTAFNIQNYFYPNISGLSNTGDTVIKRVATSLRIHSPTRQIKGRDRPVSGTIALNEQYICPSRNSNLIFAINKPR